MRGFKKTLWIILIVFAVFTFNNVYERNKIEKTSENVAVTVDSKALFKNKELEIDVLLGELKNAGVTNIALSENTLAEMQTRGLISIHAGAEITNSIFNQIIEFKADKDSTYIRIEDEELSSEIADIILHSKLGTVNVIEGKDAYIILEINRTLDKLINIPVLPINSDVRTLSKYFDLTLRVSDYWEGREEIIQDYIDSLSDNVRITNVIFAGKAAPLRNGVPDDYWSQYQIGMIEVFDAANKQENVTKYVRDNDFNAFRVHSLAYSSFNELNDGDFKRLVLKAVNERNIRMFYINLPQSLELNGEYPSFERIKTLKDSLEIDGYHVVSEIKPFDKPMISNLNMVFAGLSLVVLTLLFVDLVVVDLFKKQLPAIALTILGVLGAAVVVVGVENSLLYAVMSLWVTIMVPSYMVILVYRNRNSLSRSALKLIAIYLIGMMILIALNAGLDKILYVQGFKGVSLTLVLPILFSIGYLFIKNIKSLSPKTWLNRPIKVLDVIVVGILFLVGMYYLNRSGNSGVMIPFEQILRNGLEDALSVRPRTKEFLIAMPLIVVMLFYAKKYQKAIYLLPIFAMYVASTFNTFTHFHTPIEISVIRTIYGMILGLMLGVLVILLIEIMKKILKKAKVFLK